MNDFNTPTATILSVFTAESDRELAESNGTKEWALDPSRVRRDCKYLIIERNARPSLAYPPRYGVGAGEHREVVLIGRGLMVHPIGPNSRRHRISFTEFARPAKKIILPNQSQNPVKYRSVEDLSEIDFTRLVWHPFEELLTSGSQPQPQASQAPQAPPRASGPAPDYTVMELMDMLAKKLGQHPDTIARKLLAP